MSPEEIITKQVSRVKGVRINIVQQITRNILQEIKDNGYKIVSEYERYETKDGR